MIEKEGHEFCLLCDICGEPHEDNPFESFFEAVDAAKASSWEIERLSNGNVVDWTHTCTTCLEG